LRHCTYAASGRDARTDQLPDSRGRRDIIILIIMMMMPIDMQI
jgi:hypothetical protein